MVDDNPATRREVVAYARDLLESPKALERQPEESTGAVRTEDSEPDAKGPPRLGGDAEDSSQAGTPATDGWRSGGASSQAVKHDRPVVDREAEREETASRLAAEGELPRGRRQGIDEKRVRNDRIKRELGVKLLFSSYKEGLAAIAEGDNQPFDELVGP